MEVIKFDSMRLSQEVLAAIDDINYTEMTKIQEGAIPLVLEGKDVIGRSSTGTGKTAAFGIPAVESLKDSLVRKPQVLVLCPTRELAMQISEEVSKFAKYTPNVRLATVYGGESMINQIRELKTANFIIGTPGRIMDHMRRGTLKLGDLKMVILDEADEMLNMGFYEDIQTILVEAPKERQTLLFSATMPPAIMKITKEFQNDPVIIAVDKGQRTIDTIGQYYYYVPQARKKDALNLILQVNKNSRSLIFCNTKKMVDELSEFLNDHGHKVAGLHGDMKQSGRTLVMNSFKAGKVQILIATDVAARGIDVEDIEAVYNFDIPQEYEYYIHRIGRTGRAGKKGSAYTFACNPGQIRRVREIKSFVGTEITECRLPSAEDFMKESQQRFIEKLKVVLEEKHSELWNDQIDSIVAEGYELKEISSALMGMLVAKDKNIAQMLKTIAPIQAELRNERHTEPKRDFGNGSNRGYSNVSNGITLRVNIGRDQKVAPNFIVGAIVDATGVPAKAIGKIDIYADHTLFDMSAEEARLVLDQMQGSKIRSIPVTFTSVKRVGNSKKNYKGADSYGRAGKERNKPYMKKRMQ